MEPSTSAPLGRFEQRDRLDAAKAIGEAELTDGERLVCLAILLHWFGNEQTCCPGDRALTSITRVSLRTINRAREKAEEAGIMRSKRVGKGPLTYTFHVSPDDTCQNVSHDTATSCDSERHVPNGAVSHANGSDHHVPSTARASEKDPEKDPEKESAGAAAASGEGNGTASTATPTTATPLTANPDPWQAAAQAVTDAYMATVEERAGVLPSQPPPKDGRTVVDLVRGELAAADRDDPAKVTAAAVRVTRFFATGFPSDRNMPPLWRLASFETFRRQWDMAQEAAASPTPPPRRQTADEMLDAALRNPSLREFVTVTPEERAAVNAERDAARAERRAERMVEVVTGLMHKRMAQGYIAAVQP